ncbi:hypothetical protein R5O87_22070 [Arthrobacter globiformis]
MPDSGVVVNRVRRFFGIGALILASALVVVACSPDPTQPDLSSREPFARSVVAAAASGSVEQVEKLVPKVYVKVRPDAQRLVDSARAWDPETVQLRLSNDFPEIAQVEAIKPGRTTGIKYTISWNDGRWNLDMGVSSYRPTGNAVPGTPNNPQRNRPEEVARADRAHGEP